MVTMDNQYYRQVEAELATILSELALVVTPDDLLEVNDLIGHGEYGLALETLSGVLTEAHTPIPRDVYERMIALATRMGNLEDVHIDMLAALVKE
jgi:hypothetical protein